MITLIAACDLNLAIGNKQSLLTHLPKDLKYFKQQTLNKTVVMGRLTYESIGKPLPNRHNIILTSNRNFKAKPGVTIMDDIEQVLHFSIRRGHDVTIIGGQTLYEQFLPFADKVLLTIIDHKFPEADTYFPMLDDTWRIESSVKNKADEKNPYDHYFVTYTRK